MYNISYFKANKQEEVLAFMKAHPFVVLCGVDTAGKPVATHLPVLITERDDRLFLQAHSMRKQSHTSAFENNQNVLAIFHGAHDYISATLYNEQNTASTWNYSAVHASGTLHFLDDAGLYELLINLTNHFEGNPHSPASVNAMSEEYVRNHMKAIVAFEIEVTDLQHVFKLSQNKSKKEKATIIQHLTDGNMEQQKLAEQMKRHIL
jgi:transcriptional regulator